MVSSTNDVNYSPSKRLTKEQPKHKKSTSDKHRTTHEVQSSRVDRERKERTRQERPMEPDTQQTQSTVERSHGTGSVPMTGDIPSQNDNNIGSHEYRQRDAPPSSSRNTGSSHRGPDSSRRPPAPSSQANKQSGPSSGTNSNSVHKGELPPVPDKVDESQSRNVPDGVSQRHGARDRSGCEYVDDYIPPEGDVRSTQSEGGQKKRDEREQEEREIYQRALKEKKQQLERLKNEVAAATEEYSRLGQTNQELRAHAESLKDQWNRDLQTLEAQRKVLNASRSFAAREGTLDAATLIQSFNDLNSSIGDFSFEVLRGLNEAADENVLKDKDYALLHKALEPTLRPFVKRIQERKLDLRASDIIDPLVTGILTAQLMHVVFQPFAPGLDPERSDVLKRLHRKMCDSEPQERSARWRSITYNHAVSNPDENFLANAAKEFVDKIYNVLKALSGGTQEDLTAEFLQLAVSIFESAIKVQNRAKTEYVSFDYEVYAPSVDDPYNKDMMDLQQAKGNSTASKVWFSVALGMRAERRIQGQKESEKSIPVKATVICDNWDHEA